MKKKKGTERKIYCEYELWVVELVKSKCDFRNQNLILIWKTWNLCTEVMEMIEFSWSQEGQELSHLTLAVYKEDVSILTSNPRLILLLKERTRQL